MCGGTAECQIREMAMGGGQSVGSPSSGMLVVEAQLEGRTRQALVDTGCSVTMVNAAAVTRHCMEGWRTCLEVMDSNKIWTLGSVQIKSLTVCGVELGPREMQVMQWLPLDVDVVIGLDTIMDNGLSVSVRWGQVQAEFHGGVVAVAEAELCNERKAASSCWNFVLFVYIVSFILNCAICVSFFFVVYYVLRNRFCSFANAVLLCSLIGKHLSVILLFMLDISLLLI